MVITLFLILETGTQNWTPYKFKKSIKRRDSYTPIYWYLLLTDSMHNKKFEWNAYSICDGKYYKFFQQVYGEYYVFLNNITCEDKLDRK